MVMLTADGGQMTVGRRAGTYTYGTFQVILPDGREQQSTDDRLQDGYISRPPGESHGRFDITFVRADTTIDLGTGTSDLEQVIDTAQKRIAGDTFFERDITGRGLGHWRPGIDYTTGDLIDVIIWGKTLTLPVTATDMTSDDRGHAGWRVHVGGQLIGDAAALRKQNSDLEAQIAAEKRQRLREVGAVRETAVAADDRSQGTADGLTGDPEGDVAAALADATTPIGSVKSTALSAREKADALNLALTGTVDGDLALAVENHTGIAGEIMVKAEQFGLWSVEKQEDLNTAFALAHDYQATINEGNLIAWTTQTEWNEQVQALITEGVNRDEQMQEVWTETATLQAAIGKANATAVQALELSQTTRVVLKKINTTVQSGEFLSAINYNGSLHIDIKTGWTGRLVVQRWTGTTSSNVPVIDAVPITAFDWSTRKTYASDFDALVIVEPDPGRPMVESFTAGRFDVVPAGTWVDVPALVWTTSHAGDHDMSVNLTWSAATYLPDFGVRIVVDGTVVASKLQANIGPLFGSGARTQTLKVSSPIPQGKVIKVQARTSTSTESGRVMREASLTIAHTAPAL